MKKCAVILKAEILKENVTQIDHFLFLFDCKWSEDFAKKAHTTLYEHKWNTEAKLPIGEDIKRLHSYLTEQCAKLAKEFKVTKNSELFEKIMEICLCRTLVLNRRLTGETVCSPERLQIHARVRY